MTNTTAAVVERIRTLTAADIKTDEPLAFHCTFKIGGNAAAFALPTDVQQLACLIKSARELSVKYFILGHGSNILFDDAGYDGLVISTERMNRAEIHSDELFAECGALLTHCAVMARDASLSGMECLYGIPGSIGGAVFMNAGAYGAQMSDIVTECEYLDGKSLTIRRASAEELRFGYRTSAFRDNGGIILSARLKLRHDDREAVCERMAEYKRRRIEKQPLEYPSAGSVFKRYPGTYTAQLIDEAGLKGSTVGDAQVSQKHAGFIINLGNATAADVRELICRIKAAIREKNGIDIETEIIEAQ